MAQTFFHQAAHSGHSTPSHYSNVSATLSAESKDNDSDSKDDCDDDVMRYNKRLKDRRDRLLEELTRLENENKMHCDKLRDLLKPLQLTNKIKQNKQNNEKKVEMNKKIKKWDTMIAEHMSKYCDDEENKYETQLKSNALDGIEEFKMPQITEKMNDEERKDFLSLLIRYLCLANNYQRNEIKSLYAKQRSLYFQAQGLSLHEQRQFLETLSRPIPAFQTIEKQKNAALQQVLAKFPDPHKISDKYEEYTRLIKQVNVIAQDTDTNWQSSVIKTSIDELQSSMSYNANPSSPRLTTKYSYSQSNDDDIGHTVSRTKHKPKKSLFGFRRNKSTEKITPSVDKKAEKSIAIETESVNTTKEMSVSSTGSDQVRSPKSISYETQKAVAMMGSKANAPNVASMSRNTAISGARLVRFDANYKQLQSRRQRCDVGCIVAALQNTHNMHTRMKQRVPNVLGENPFLCEQNFGFDMRYCDGKIYTFDTILDDKEMLRKYKEESQKNNQPMTPVTTTFSSLRPQSAHFSAQSTLTNIQGWETLLSHTQGLESGSSRNLHSIINATDVNHVIHTNDDVDSKLSKEDDLATDTNGHGEETRKWSNDMAQVFTQASKTVMNVNKEKEKGRPGWITLNQFIHLATNFGAHGLRDAQVLVLTHKIFCESKALLKGLRRRFWMPIPPNITPSEMSAFRQTYVKQIRGKIIAVLRYWLTKHWCDDFRDESGLQHRMNKFISEINENKESESMSIYLAQAFEKEKKANTINSLLDDRAKLQTAQKKKVVKFFYDAKTMDILDFNPSETAACIVELNCKSFLLIDQRECFECIKHKEKGPNVACMIARWNAMGNWVQRELLSQRRDFKKRLQCLRYFIQIVNILSDLGDFSGAYAINSALHSTPVHRLKTYFVELTRKEHNTLKGMRELFTVSGNYPNLRQKMKNYLSKPCVPHIGLFTRDLTMLAEKESTKMINNKKYINFGKCQTLAKQMNDLKMYQNNINKFNLQYQKPLLDYVETQLENPIKSENDLYNMSIQVEPKATNM